MALVLAVMMVLGVASVASAASITLNRAESYDSNDLAANNEAYKAYKIFDATKTATGIGDTTDANVGTDQSSTTGISYFVKTGNPWKATLEGINITYGDPATTKAAFKWTAASDGTGWTVALNDEVPSTDTTAKAIAAALQSAIASVTLEGEYAAKTLTPGTALSVDDGYYLITSTLGNNLVLATSDITIKEKNEYPSVDKEVQEDSDESWGKKNDAEIGQIVNYQTKIPIKAGAKNYHLYDKLSNGLTLKADSITVKIITTPATGEATTSDAITSTDKFTVKTGNEAAIYEGTDKSSFDIAFEDSWLANYVPTEDNTYTILVEYKATVNEDAVIASTGNPNNTYLSFGEGSKTTEDETRTYVYQFDLVKKNASNIALAGAKFNMYRADDVDGEGKLKSDATPISFVKEDTTYKVADTTTETTNDIVSVADSKVTIVGLDADVYYLQETEAPTGYNKLDELVKITVTKEFDTTNTKTISATKVAVDNGSAVSNTATFETVEETVTYSNGGAAILNQSGSVLPSTGGIGTTIFYILGAVLVIGAGVLLVTKRRMTAE